MRQFLKLDINDMNRSSKKAMSVEDQEALKRMENSEQIVDGHSEIAMLWKSVIPWLPNSKQMAEARLQSLKRKLQRKTRRSIESTESLWRKSLKEATPES